MTPEPGGHWSAVDLDAAILETLDGVELVDDAADPVGPHGANAPGETDA